MMQRGRDIVDQLVKYRPAQARQAIDQVVETAVQSNNRPLLSAMLTQFGDVLVKAGDEEFQRETNDLLWYFKATLEAELQRISA